MVCVISIASCSLTCHTKSLESWSAGPRSVWPCSHPSVSASLQCPDARQQAGPALDLEGQVQFGLAHPA